MGLAIAQFIVTGILLGVVATLAYLAGMRSAGKEAGGAGGPAAATTGGPAAAVDVATLLKSSPELVAKGKTLFTVNCASCHGVEGKGNGPAAVALNPKPRDFTGTYWRYGGGVARIVQTISTGSPGTAMAAFTMIPIEDRFALAHYVRTFGTKPEEDKPQDLAWLGPVGGAPGGAGVAGIGAAAKPGPSIPVELAVRLVAEPSPLVGSPAAVAAPAGAGADLYAVRCASCHGVAGAGGVKVRMLGSSPYVYVATPSLAASRLGWTSDAARFEKLILEGIPGYVMPGNGDLTRGEIHDLYQYSLRLRAYQESTPAVVAPPAPNVPTRS